MISLCRAPLVSQPASHSTLSHQLNSIHTPTLPLSLFDLQTPSPYSLTPRPHTTHAHFSVSSSALCAAHSLPVCFPPSRTRSPLTTSEPARSRLLTPDDLSPPRLPRRSTTLSSLAEVSAYLPIILLRSLSFRSASLVPVPTGVPPMPSLLALRSIIRSRAPAYAGSTDEQRLP